MASRKKPVDTQASLFNVVTSPSVPRDTVVIADKEGELVGTIVNLAVEDQKVIERPKLRLVAPPTKLPESEIIVEKVGDVYEVSLLRDHGTTVAAVFYTRKQLEQLIARAQGALEIG